MRRSPRLDGYVEDEDGWFDWAAPGDEVHEFVNDLERPIGTYLYGRRMYETTVFLETVSNRGRAGDVLRLCRDQGQPRKVGYSRTLQTVFQGEDADRARVRPSVVRRLTQSSGAGHRSRGLFVEVSREGIPSVPRRPRRCRCTARPRRCRRRRSARLAGRSRSRRTRTRSCRHRALRGAPRTPA